MEKEIKYNRDLPSIRLLNLDAKDIYKASLNSAGLEIKNSKELFDYRFTDIVPPNLDLLYLYEKGKLNLKTSQNEFYSFEMVNVSFQKPYYEGEYNPKNKQKPTLYVDQLRKELYLKGFLLNNKRYVRYKRSAGSAKKGSCLFIQEDLFSMMNKWSDAGLDENSELCARKITSFEAYKALSISGLISTLKLKPHNILFVKDNKVKLKKEYVEEIYVDYVGRKETQLEARDRELNVKNNIFDGEGLLDESVFKKVRLSKKGMMLLRNRFFKCCAFNTKLQEWFKENNITSVDELNGFTFASSIEDIVLVVSESCLKYIKFLPNGFTKENIKAWCDSISNEDGSSLFGIVKTDKDTRFFDGEMVETTYQLLNTLQMKDKDVKALIAPNIHYMDCVKNIRDYPEYLRLYLEGTLKEDIGDLYDDSETDYFLEAENFSEYSYKSKVCLELMKIDRRTLQTDLFKKYVYEDLINGLALKFYHGRVLVNGLYATLLGNPYEYLKYIILDKKKQSLFDEKNSLLKSGQIYCSYFEDNAKIVSSRAPHITMGNVLRAKNKHLPEIDRWFNLTKNIVVVDAINNNIQQMLNGCDYDSDSMLLTDNEVLFNSIKHFPIPYSDFEYNDKPLKKLSKDKKENHLLNLYNIDKAIAQNITGRIINLSQLLNSHLWHKLKKDKNYLYHDLYDKIATLAILSGAEIDSAKKDFPFKTKKEYERINKYAQDNGYLEDIPLFYHNISSKEKLTLTEIEKVILDENNKRFATTMDYLWVLTHEHELEKHPMSTVSLFSLISSDFSTEGLSKSKYNQAKEVVNNLFNLKKTLQAIKKSKYNIQKFELQKNDFNYEMKKCFDSLKIKLNSIDKAKLAIKLIEKGDFDFIKEKKVSKNSLLYFLLYIICTHPNDLPYKLSDLFPKGVNGVPKLRKVNPNEVPQFTLFDKYDYVIDENDVYASKIIDEIFKKVTKN